MPAIRTASLLRFASLAALAVAYPVASSPPAPSPVDPDLIVARMAFATPPMNVVTLRSFDRLFDSEWMAPVARAEPLRADKAVLDISYTIDGKSYDLDQYLARTHTNALVVLHDGRIVAERYRNGMAAESAHSTMSISKSYVATLIGIAIDRGEIASIDVPITRYAPEFAGTAYEGVTLRQALQMRSGVAFNEEGADFLKYLETVIAGNQQRCADFIRTAPRAHPPGSHFNYSSPETCVIARVLERATGKSLAAYMEEHLWKPGGMEHPGYWVLDGRPGTGGAISNGGLSVTARDLARFGQIMLDRGMAGSKRIVSARWVDEATATDGRAGAPRGDGYGYQWWTLGEPDSFAGIGYAGQYLYVVPSQRLVIARFSYWPTGGDPKLEAETRAGFQAIGAALAAQDKD